ncbi:MAG: hypothetical protein COT81_03645 [Candidatus Buchananbacteria bacterium CG10_big_fil_rev_8_21_14_0_10_42_9]|uniref:Uncharacterized protein n=1 Tax=Candidatus Buchananbacteria bacterium CG10_big_fil_rev_8_21_14_0_10_42_9 TaxID=1974526 RepID=A0A2H0W0R0_9BACT|nr:MAG: hypothetical protein COT81_03645 [Candidatus Buchananbacteria bacterium CG10_big_fil_rev_8_21_14_0_10_42_9]
MNIIVTFLKSKVAIGGILMAWLFLTISFLLIPIFSGPVFAQEEDSQPIVVVNVNDKEHTGGFFRKVGTYVSDGLTGLAFTIIGIPANAILYLVNLLRFVLYGVLGILTEYSNYVNAQPVLVGWPFVRDISNMFFILILLLISVATILKIERYNYKKALPRLLLMAVLINFSRTITGLVIDFGQVAMNALYGQIKGIGYESLLETVFSTPELYSFEHYLEGLKGVVSIETESGVTFSSLLISTILGLILSSITLIVVAVYVVMFAARIIALWVLIILSPIAFLAAAIPGGESYFRQWWSELVKYVLIGPILLFFLLLSTRVGSELNFSSNQNADRIQEALNTIGISNAGSVDYILSLVVAVVFLMVGLAVASRAGTAGAGLASAASNKIKSTGMRGLSFTAGALGRKVDRQLARGRFTKFLSPTVIREGYKKNHARLDRQAFTKPIGEAADFFRNLRPIEATKGLIQKARIFPGTKLEDYEKAKAKVNELAANTTGGLSALTADQIDSYDAGTKKLIEQGIAKEKIRESEKEKSIVQKDIVKLDTMMHDSNGNEISSTKFQEAIEAVLRKLDTEITDDQAIIAQLAIQRGRAERGGDINQVKALEDEIKQKEEKIAQTKGEANKLDKYNNHNGKALAAVDISSNRSKLRSINDEIETYVQENKTYRDEAQQKFFKGKTESELKAMTIRTHRPETERAERAAINEELAELPRNAMDASDLLAQARDALNKGEKERFSALMIKAAQDYNGNEILPEFNLDGDMPGYEKFVNNILVKQLGMGEQSALRLLDDIAYINEDNNQRSGSRLVGTDKTGAKRLLTQEEHNMLVEIEINKANPRAFQQNANRLSYGYHNADGSYVIDKFGLNYIASNINDIVYRIGRGELNPNALAHFALRKDQIEEAIKTGLIDALSGKKLINAINSKLGQSVRSDAQSIEESIKAAQGHVV